MQGPAEGYRDELNVAMEQGVDVRVRCLNFWDNIRRL